MRLAVLFSIVFLSSSFTGCLGFGDDDEGFSWPDIMNADCSLETEYDLICEPYLNILSKGTPITSLHYEPLNEIWVAYQGGLVLGYNGDTVRHIGNLSTSISRCHFEQGLLGMVFVDNQEFSKVLISYIEKDICEGSDAAPLILGEINIENHGFSAENITVLEKVEQPYRNHNSGHIIHVMNNQYLWGIGDGGSSNDPHNNGQNESTLLGSIVLITYENGNVEFQMLHSGLRNPWRFDVDPHGSLWVADVGQNCFEEVNYIDLWNQSANFGWSLREGFHNFDAESDCNISMSQPQEGITDPVIEYSHRDGHCSITGGFWMDWGPSELQNGYLYGDFCSGTIWLAKKESSNFTQELIADTGIQITGFGKGLNNELLIFDWGGKVVKLEEISNSNVNS